ncbi:MAG: hypothetical protein A3H27_11240 [Acidobacteria bacterium RIFCSPLOWO2_02_FULL_59_13]|nr:MAG: hypothetical protein A3H27_11240 [Acidobacteria bacterium RIFCSPLOWO2_02_FULL_59_13]
MNQWRIQKGEKPGATTRAPPQSRGTAETGFALRKALGLADFLDLGHTASLVITALGTGMMRQLLFVTLGTGHQLDSVQKVVPPTFALPGMRMSSFRIWHETPNWFWVAGCPLPYGRGSDRFGMKLLCDYTMSPLRFKSLPVNGLWSRPESSKAPQGKTFTV